MCTTDNLLRGGLLPPKFSCLTQDQIIDPRYPDPSPTCQHPGVRFCEHHAVDFLVQGRIQSIKQLGYVQGWKDSRSEVFRCGVPKFPNGLSHLGFPVFFLEVTLQVVLEGMPK